MRSLTVIRMYSMIEISKGARIFECLFLCDGKLSKLIERKYCKDD